MPADPEDPAKPWAAALLEDAAVQLPKKHCAFRGCGWSGSEEEERMAHLQRTHGYAVGLVAGLLPECYSREERFAAAYSEAIATIVRKGAPTALYSIDRRCLFNYATACRKDQVEAPSCFSVHVYTRGWRNTAVMRSGGYSHSMDTRSCVASVETS